MYDSERNLLFIHIPKTAGRAVSLALMDGYHVHEHLTSLALTDRHHVHEHLTYKQCEDNFEKWSVEKKPFVFAVIRNPYERFVSNFNQLVGKRHKRTFSKFKKFQPQDFRLWVKTAWFPHYNGKNIQVDDEQMQNWLNTEAAVDKPHGFNPDTYDVWLKNSKNNFSSIDAFLDFSLLPSELKNLQEKLRKYDLSKYKKFEMDHIVEPNRWYDNFWDKESKEMFESLAQSDIKFYERFHNVQ